MFRKKRDDVFLIQNKGEGVAILPAYSCEGLSLSNSSLSLKKQYRPQIH
jgi:hypothetical protein